MSKKLTQLIKNDFVNIETGEIQAIETRKTYTVSNEPNYIKLYLDDLMRLKNLPISTNGFFMTILKTMDYENRVFITKSVKETIIKQMNISKRTLERLIENCIKKGLMTKLDSATFVLNPNIFGRGSWQNIKEIQMLVSYSEKGRLLLNYEEYKKRIDMPSLFQNEEDVKRIDKK